MNVFPVRCHSSLNIPTFASPLLMNLIIYDIACCDIIANMTDKPLFITFEGCDGTGKSTQAKLLANNMNALLTSDPKGTDYGREITDKAIANEHDWTLAFAFLSARAALTDNIIMPELKSGRTVICDRFMDSTLVYQGTLGGLDANLLTMFSLTASHDLKPDCTVLLMYDDVETMHSHVVMRARMQGERLDRFDRMDEDHMRTVQNGFMRLADAEPDRFIVIHCDGKSIESIHSEILKGLEAKGLL